MTSAEKKRRHRLALFKKQDGICYWCPALMVDPLRSRQPQRVGTKPNPLQCTIDHLDDRYNPVRGAPGHIGRHVAACWTCNNRRGQERTAALPLIELHRRSGRARTIKDNPGAE